MKFAVWRDEKRGWTVAFVDEDGLMSHLCTAATEFVARQTAAYLNAFRGYR